MIRRHVAAGALAAARAGGEGDRAGRAGAAGDHACARSPTSRGRPLSCSPRGSVISLDRSGRACGRSSAVVVPDRRRRHRAGPGGAASARPRRACRYSPWCSSSSRSSWRPSRRRSRGPRPTCRPRWRGPRGVRWAPTHAPSPCLTGLARLCRRTRSAPTAAAACRLRAAATPSPGKAASRSSNVLPGDRSRARGRTRRVPGSPTSAAPACRVHQVEVPLRRVRRYARSRRWSISASVRRNRGRRWSAHHIVRALRMGLAKA